ncbi:MAG: GatB/YqeY domain-containing protein [Deltaproteobacteria bacterium]|nr:GatB/YqeY domain-containing protein [Deltaproteobacteria bacterium]
MSLREKLDQDLKEAMKGREKERLSVLRMVRSEIKNQEIRDRRPLDESALLTLLARSAKQRRDSIDQFRKGGREDLAAQETRELEILLDYLPKPLTDDELRKVVEKTVTRIGAISMKEMGTVMKQVMAEVGGRADGKRVQQMVREVLS